MTTSAPSVLCRLRGLLKWSSRVSIWVCRSMPLRLLLDGHPHGITPLGPGAVVVADLGVAEQLVQHEPGVAGALADAAVGDDVLVRRDALALVERAQLVGRLEGLVGVGGLRLGDR